MNYKLSNPDGKFVKSAHISYCGTNTRGDIYSCSVLTCYAHNSHCVNGKDALKAAAKIWFGRNYMTGGKWIEENYEI